MWTRWRDAFSDRINCKGSIRFPSSSTPLLFLLQRVGEIVLRKREIGFQPDRCFSGGDARVPFTERVVAGRDVVVRLGVGRPQRQRLAGARDALLEPAGLVLSERQRQKRLRRRPLFAERLLQQRL